MKFSFEGSELIVQLIGVLEEWNGSILAYETSFEFKLEFLVNLLCRSSSVSLTPGQKELRISKYRPAGIDLP